MSTVSWDDCTESFFKSKSNLELGREIVRIAAGGSMTAIRKGIHKHYKGKFYEVLGAAHHSETLEELVVYRALYKTRFGRNSLWVRPQKMFLEKVVLGGVKVPRFKFISSKTKSSLTQRRKNA